MEKRCRRCREDGARTSLEKHARLGYADAEMTAKEALREMVERLTDDQAVEWLLQMRDVPPPVPWRQRAAPPGWREMAAMSVLERRAVFLRWPADIDMDEFLEWERGTIADAELIDA